MPDTTSSLLPVIHAARTANDPEALRAACQAYLAAARSEKKSWATDGGSRFEILPLHAFDLAAVMLAGAGKEVCVGLWRRHTAATADPAEMDLISFRDYLLAHIGMERFPALPETPPSDGPLEERLMEQIWRLREAHEAFSGGSLAAVERSAVILERSNMNLLAVAVRDLAVRRGIKR
jgi:hypothetical protein